MISICFCLRLHISIRNCRSLGDKLSGLCTFLYFASPPFRLFSHLICTSRPVAFQTPFFFSRSTPQVVALLFLFYSPTLPAQHHSRSALLVYARPIRLAIRRLYTLRYNDTTATMRANWLPNVSVKIQVNGNSLPEYQVDSGDAMAGLSFVETIDGAPFSIVLIVLPDYQHRDGDLELCISLDGCKARSLTISSDWVKKGNNFIIIDSTHDYANGLASSKKFTFGKTEQSTYRLTTWRNKQRT